MDSLKTELFKVTFDDEATRPCVTITHEKTEDYHAFFSLAALCVEVDELLQWGSVNAVEAIKIIRKSASFFILNGQ